MTSKYFLEASAVYMLNLDLNLVSPFGLENMELDHKIITSSFKNTLFTNVFDGHFGQCLVLFCCAPILKGESVDHRCYMMQRAGPPCMGCSPIGLTCFICIVYCSHHNFTVVSFLPVFSLTSDLSFTLLVIHPAIYFSSVY